MAKSNHFYIRKLHRYLGLILGIQFLLWTAGGLYFSWSDMDEIHGDFQKKELPLLPAGLTLVSPGSILDSIKKSKPVDSIVSVQLISMLGQPVYQLRCTGAGIHPPGNEHRMPVMNFLADAITGRLRGPLSKEEAVQVAASQFNGMPEVKSVEYLTHTGRHHEYRENPLPAYAIRFEHPSQTTVYVASELGTVQKFRNQKWRVFDFLWMMHTMDYEGRDNFSNGLLRAFSIFGLVTVLSGFLLFAVSAGWFRNRRRVR